MLARIVRVSNARFASLIPLVVALVFAYWWDTTVANASLGSEMAWVAAVGSMVAAALVLLGGWSLYRAGTPAVIADLVYLAVGAVLVFAHPLSTVGIGLPWFSDLRLYTTIEFGVLLKSEAPFFLIFGLAGLAAGLSLSFFSADDT